jgi:NAD(P)-dependent dehydrogenase (short-subunit alcohol dehydrogenase family)
MGGALLEGRVAVVTGAGRGLGRAHALALAAAGARVVVNDIGTSLEGAGRSDSPANDVVAEIRAAGGEAAASFESVVDHAGARRMVEQALEEFGRLDIVVNNAGIVKQTPIDQLDEDEFDRTIAVHLKGAFNLCRHAVPHMKSQRHGRIINTASSQWRAPMGMPAYAAAKGGVVSLTWDLAWELKDFGITANAIAPFAMTRMTGGDDVRGQAVKGQAVKVSSQGEERTDAAFVSPLVVYLASDHAARVNGCVFRVGAGKVAKFSHPMEEAALSRDHRIHGPWTVEELAAQLPDTVFASSWSAPHVTQAPASGWTAPTGDASTSGDS